MSESLDELYKKKSVDLNHTFKDLVLPQYSAQNEFRCSKVYTIACDGCEGSNRERDNCPEWECANEISNAIRAMLAHIKNSKKE